MMKKVYIRAQGVRDDDRLVSMQFLSAKFFYSYAEKMILLPKRKFGSLDYWYTKLDQLFGPVYQIFVSATRSFFRKYSR